MGTGPEHLRVTPGRVTRLQNKNCPYCGRDLEETGSTKEHVVGRRFVPRGTLNQQWNLILHACGDCNRLKATLEDELSALSMYPSLVGPRDPDGAIAVRDMGRKTRGSTGRRADRDVQRFGIGGQMGPGISVRFGLVAPPSPPPDHIRVLARFQMAGFFYWITYDGTRQTGGFWVGDFKMANWTGRTDWGNPVQNAFAKSVSVWQPRLVVETAEGFFKGTIRRDPSAACWGWAVEWNKNYRAIGFFGEQAVVQGHLARLPTLETSLIGKSEDGELHVRVERPLLPDEDLLFAMPPPGDA